MLRCEKCGDEIYRETDDMITCGGMFEVWYSKISDGRRSMSCHGNVLVAHTPIQSAKESNLGIDR
jgi:hypothetical protein